MILEDMEAMKTPLASFSVEHVRRSGNSVAHLCAKYASSSRSSLLWQDEPPSFLLPSLLCDCNMLHI